MDEQNLNLNEGHEDVVDSQNGQAEQSVMTVNADNADVTTGKQEGKQVQSAEENARFAEVRRKTEAEAKAKARDELIAEMYGKTHGINTYAEYQQALAKQEEEQRLSELLNEGISEKFATELIENRKFREQYEAEQRSKQQQAQQQADLQDFISAFPSVKAEEIPTEVWQANAKGVPLRYAYAEHALKLARDAEAKLKANADNAKGSMGSVSTNGNPETDYISKETFESKKGDRGWVIKNLSKINSSRAKW